MSLIDALQLFKYAGLNAAEIIWQDGYEAGLPEDDQGRTLVEVDRECRRLDLDVCALAPYMTGINSLDPVERERDTKRFRRCIVDAARLGAGLVRVYAGSFRESEEDLRDQKWALLLQSLSELAMDATARGVTLAVENHFNTMTVSATQTAQLMRDLSGASAVAILYDQANLAFTHQEEYAEAIELQKPWISHVHVKDLIFTDPKAKFTASAVNRVASNERAVRSRIVGEGVLDWPGILARLRAAGYSGPLSLEYEYRWHPQDLPAPAEGFRRSADNLRRLLEEPWR